MRHRSLWSFFACFLLVSPLPTVQAQAKPNPPLQLGDILRMMSAVNSSHSAPRPSSKPPKLTATQKAIIQDNDSLRRDIKALAAQKPPLSPDAAAAAWLALFNRFLALQPRLASTQNIPYDSLVPVPFSELVNNLPSPESWEGIHTALLQQPLPPRPTTQDATSVGKWQSHLRGRLLRLLAHRLVADVDGQFTEWVSLKQDMITLARAYPRLSKLHPADVSSLYGFLPLSYSSHNIDEQIIAQTQDPGKAIDGINWEIAASVAADSALVPSSSGGDIPAERYSISLPDTPDITILPKGKALIRRLLLSPEFGLTVRSGGSTERFVRRLARDVLAYEKRVPEKSILWGLVTDLSDDSLGLYQELIQHFPERRTAKRQQSDSASSRQEARSNYIAGLIVRGRIVEAVALAAKARPSENFFYGSTGYTLERSGHPQEYYAFLHQLLRRRPDIPLWEQIVTASATAGHTDEALDLAREHAAQRSLPREQRLHALKVWSDAALANDATEEGIRALRETIRFGRQNRSRPDTSQRSHGVNEYDNMVLQCGERLIKLSHVLNRPDLHSEGINLLTSQAAPTNQPWEDFERSRLLAVEGDPTATEQRLLRIIRNELRKSASKTQEPNYYEIVQAQTSLIGLYDRQHRWEDILLLLQQSPFWSGGDLRSILTQETTGTTIGMAVAHALNAQKRTAEAVAITREVLAAEPTTDANYALYLNLVGAEASLAYMDELATEDRFEPRPLIWKAVALFRLKRFGEAERAARTAIQIDPSDGNSPHGDRMRAYAVLADIRQAQGDTKEAAFFRSVVHAIRIAEQGDDFEEAGLTTRAIHLYETALTFFDNAYCIQSRLAVHLADQGKLAEAEVHFRKAYELMPDSFGRRESHCFGCEGAFSSPQGAQIAEHVLTKMATERPNKPQIYYLLGYVQADQNRYQEALQNLKKAVTLDPDYINAWIQLAKLQGKTLIPAEEKDTILQNLIRLSPRNALSSSLPEDEEPDAVNGPTLAQKYRLIEAQHNTQQTGEQNPLFPLTASAAYRSKQSPYQTSDLLAQSIMEQVTPNDQIIQYIIEQINSSPGDFGTYIRSDFGSHLRIR